MLPPIQHHRLPRRVSDTNRGGAVQPTAAASGGSAGVSSLPSPPPDVPLLVELRNPLTLLWNISLSPEPHTDLEESGRVPEGEKALDTVARPGQEAENDDGTDVGRAGGVPQTKETPSNIMEDGDFRAVEAVDVVTRGGGSCAGERGAVEPASGESIHRLRDPTWLRVSFSDRKR